MGCVLVQDPFHPYAARLLDVLHDRYGHRAVCFFTDRRARLRGARRFPALRASTVEAIYDVDVRELAGFADVVRQRHDVVGVVPYNEEVVLHAAQLADWLGLGWNSFDTMRRFRDKHALKVHLLAHDPHIRMNASRMVTTVDHVLQGGVAPFARYVLKPNDGFGNRDVAFFDDKTPAAAIESFVRGMRAPLVLEEYIGGEEYFVNGQVDSDGTVVVVAVFRYTRVAVNGRSNIDYETRVVRHADPLFGVLAAYACRVASASGLRRSPFHIEIKIDDRGPCLIEMGARLAGNGNAWVCNSLHGGKLDVFDAAAHGYVSRADYGPLGLNWDHYDRTDARYVHGVATRRELIHEVDGVDEVEALSSFASWVKKPLVGDRIEPTVSSLTMPWCVVLMAPRATTTGDDAALAEAAAVVRRLIRINRRRAPARRAAVLLQKAVARVDEMVRWHVARATPANSGGPMPRDTRERTLRLAEEFARSTADAVIRRLKLKGLLRRYREQDLPELRTPSRIAQAGEIMRWAEDYLSAPHAELGRKGPVCPFVHKTVLLDRLFVSFHDEIDGSDVHLLQDLLMAHSERLRSRYPQAEPNGAFTSVLVVFPAVPDAKTGVLDDALQKLKSHLMATDVMISAFHARSTKPALYNPTFRVFKAPLPCVVLRHMDVRDIVFLDHNRLAFARYRRRFEDRFARGLVSNEFGYVDRYNEATERFPRK